MSEESWLTMLSGIVGTPFQLIRSGRLRSLSVVVLLFSGVLSTGFTQASLSAGNAPKRERLMDVGDILAKVGRQKQLSLVVAGNVRGFVTYKPGETMAETLDQSLSGMGFRWRLIDNCLYVGLEPNMRIFLDRFHSHQQDAPKVTHGGALNAEFNSIDLFQLSRMLSRFSSIQIRIEPGIKGTMMLKAVGVPWERILLALVYLNGFRMVQSDFSVFIME